MAQQAVMQNRYSGILQVPPGSESVASAQRDRNLFMHYAFDEWMKGTYPYCPFERYADDTVIHCKTEAQARFILDKVIIPAIN